MAFTYDLARFLTFRDAKECARVRAIKRADICTHPNANFTIRVIEDAARYSSRMSFGSAVRLKLLGRVGAALMVLLVCATIYPLIFCSMMISCCI